MNTLDTLELHFIDEVTGDTFELHNDFMQYVSMNGNTIGPRHDVLPNIIHVNWHAGYAVKKDRTIICAIEANNHIASYEGCKESELSQMYAN